MNFCYTCMAIEEMTMMRPDEEGLDSGPAPLSEEEQ